MKKTVLGLMLTCCILALGVVSASAQVPTHMVFDMSGTASLVVSPVVMNGTITAGEPLLNGGYWTLTVDDTGWPADTDKQARWDYIAATYYTPNYDAMFGTWTGMFDGNTTNSEPSWMCGKAGVGLMSGTAVLQTTISDFDFDAVIDPDERGFMIFSGTLIVVKNGDGLFAGYCGIGSYSGSSLSPDPWNFAAHNFSGSTVLDIDDCSLPIEEVSWGNLKAMYQ